MRTSSRGRGAVLASIAMAGAVLLHGFGAQAGEAIPLQDLAKRTHVHGIAVDREDPSKLLIATHHGLFSAGPEGLAERISPVQDFMGFSPHPVEPATFYASGHPASGGNLGVVRSVDGGRSWTQVSPGGNEPVDFHQMTISPADPNRIYGNYGGLRVSRDGGSTWEDAGPAPQGLIDLAASGKDPDVLYAGTEKGLMISTDAGASWETLIGGAPVSMVEIAPDGSLYAFMLGRGLMRAGEPPVALRQVGSGLVEEVVLHFAADPANPDRLFAATPDGRLLASADGGESWTAFHEAAHPD